MQKLCTHGFPDCENTVDPIIYQKELTPSSGPAHQRLLICKKSCSTWNADSDTPMRNRKSLIANNNKNFISPRFHFADAISAIAYRWSSVSLNCSPLKCSSLKSLGSLIAEVARLLHSFTRCAVGITFSTQTQTRSFISTPYIWSQI